MALENENKDLKNNLDRELKEWKSYDEKINNLNSLKEDLEKEKLILNLPREMETLI